jgi:hypothetical protein
MKSFCSKVIALALFAGVLSVAGGPASPVSAFDVTACEENFAKKNLSRPISNIFPMATIGSRMDVVVESIACTGVYGGEIYAILDGTSNPLFKLSEYKRYTRVNSLSKTTWINYQIDGDALGLKEGRYRFIGGRFRDEQGREDELHETLEANGERRYLDYKPSDNSTTTSSTSSPPQSERPEVLDDQLVTQVWKPGKASTNYTATVRCSSRCGTLPDSFAAKLCEVGTSYTSSTCISSSRPFKIGKQKKTKEGVVNTFVGTFIIEKKATGKKYQAYLNIPAGKKHKPTLGLDTFVWNGKSSVKNVASPIKAPVTTVAPKVTTSTSTSVVAGSSAALTVLSDSVSGKSSLIVKGSGASVTVDVALDCSGTCTGLPASITGRMCKVGTSDADSSCSYQIKLSQISGGTSRKATFRGIAKFGSTPTGAVYQPYFSMTAAGAIGTTKLQGTSRVTWNK